MARFDRQTTEGRDLPASLDTVANEFGDFLERRVREIIEGAQVRAAEIERDANRRAMQIEQQSEDRTKRVLESLERVHSTIGGMIEELRAEPESPPAVEERGSANGYERQGPPEVRFVEAPQAGGEPQARERQLATDTQRAEQERLAALIDPERVNPEDEATSTARSAEFDEMIEAEIRGMFQDGRSREDAERFLGGFRLGDNYIGRLDEIYTQQQSGASGRRGVRGRLRRSSR